MKVAAGILSLTASAAASAPSTENEQDRGAVSSESKRPSKDRSARRGGLRKADDSSAALNAAERVEAETIDAGVLDVGATLSCSSGCETLCDCFDARSAGTADSDACVTQIYNACYDFFRYNYGWSKTLSGDPCLEVSGSDGAGVECPRATCIRGARQWINGSCVLQSETQVLSVLAQQKA